MKILLVGEYSRLHNSLKEGLQKLGHQVVILAAGDGFKNYPVDIKLEASFFKSSFGNKIRQLVYRLTKIDLAATEILKKFNKLRPQLTGFDVVQLINENPFLATPSVEKQIISFLKQHNKKLFLLSCGTDYTSVSFALKKQLKYSIFTPFFENPLLKKKYASALKYTTPEYKDLHHHIMSKIEGIIASDIDYHLPLESHPKYLGLVPNPINTDLIDYKPLTISGKIHILLGINSSNTVKKGIPIFKTVLNQLQEKHPNKISITVVEDLPYKEYIKYFDNAHIVLDQVYSYDQGYNALEAMAKGKVVFTGAETEFYNYYNLKDKVALNATPDIEKLYNNLEELVLHPEKIIEISKNARTFIEETHDYIKSARHYVSFYSGSESSVSDSSVVSDASTTS